jgi:hypothetical protein
MMTEYGYVEKPILEWLAGKATDPDDRGLGWWFRTGAEMARFDRPLEDPLVEKLLLPAAESGASLAGDFCRAGVCRWRRFACPLGPGASHLLRRHFGLPGAAGLLWPDESCPGSRPLSAPASVGLAAASEGSCRRSPRGL